MLQASSIDLNEGGVSNTNANPGKRNLRNIIDNHISMERRKGRDPSDAYHSRSKYLLQKAKEIKMITGCIVNLTNNPTWESGQKKSYHTERHEPEPYLSQSPLSNSAFDTSTDPVIHQTPSKKEKSKNQVHPGNICRLCDILWETEEDENGDSFWIGCSGESCKKKRDHECNWWVHNRCAHIHYENSDKGKANLEKWAKKHFFCPKHMPAPTKVAWDEETQEDVVLQPKGSRKFLKKAIEKKTRK